MMCHVPQLSSAVPDALERFGDVAVSGAAEVSAAASVAVPALAGARAQPGGVGAFASAALECVAAGVVGHGRRVVELGEVVGAVGAAFELPEHWATLVPGAGGCPAVALPVWARDEEGQALHEPLAAPMQLLCEPEEEERLAVPVPLALGGVVLVEARRRPPRQPRRERQLPIAPSQSPIWQNAEHHRGRVRRNERGQLMEWDYRHGEIELYDRNRRHLGAVDAVTGEFVKPPEPGRTLGG